MKLDAANLDSYKPIVEHTQVAGVPYTTVAELKGVKRLTKIDDGNALLLVDNGGSMDLRAIPLP
jgi:hypothetical protein